VKTNEKRYPLKDKPRHYPGQSLDKELEDIRFERAEYWVAFLIFVVLAIYEWRHWYQGIPPQPIPAAVVAFTIGAYAYYKDRQLQKRARFIRQGSEGEKIVGQLLDELKQKGYTVFHDIVVKGEQRFNIDHVVISTHGIFAIETKTFSKPAEENARAHFDGEKVILTGRKPDSDSVKQSIANADWLRDELKKSTGKSFRINPVVVYPGWWVDDYIGKEVWVLNPKKGLALYIDRQPESISQSDTHLAAYHLSRMVTT
jgi:hypothetical protein